MKHLVPLLRRLMAAAADEGGPHSPALSWIHGAGCFECSATREAFALEALLSENTERMSEAVRVAQVLPQRRAYCGHFYGNRSYCFRADGHSGRHRTVPRAVLDEHQDAAVVQEIADAPSLRAVPITREERRA